MRSISEDNIAEFAGVRRELLAAKHADAGFGTLDRTIAHLNRYLARPMRVAVLGEHNCGKTSLINAMMARKFLPTAVIANTRVAVTIRFGTVAGIRVKTRAGTWRNVDRTAPLDWIGRADLRAIELSVPDPLLQRFEFVDTSATDDPATSIQGADIVIWCTTATQAWTETERQVWTALPRRCRRNGILVATHSDALRGRLDREKVEARLVDEAGELFQSVFLVSNCSGRDQDGVAGNRGLGVERGETILRHLEMMADEQRSRRGRAVHRITDRLSRMRDHPAHDLRAFA